MNIRIDPKYEEVIVSLKSAKNKPANPYSLDKNTSAYHVSRRSKVSVMLFAFCLQQDQNYLRKYDNAETGPALGFLTL